MKKKRKIEKKKIARRGFRIPIDFFIFALIFPLFALLVLTNHKAKPVVKIPAEKTSETTYWKLYQNNDFFFSFKYPDYVLSNFQVETFNDTYQKVKGIAHSKEGSDGIPSYNVFFEANAWKYTGTLDDFVRKGPLNIKDLETQEIILGENHGVRVTNTSLEKQEGYFYYNIFKKDNYIYNFALLSDDRVLIDANSDLLEKIMSTAKFYP